MNQILLIIHQPTSETGRVGQLLGEWGYRLDIRCPSGGDPLPATLDEHAGVVIFGGPMSVNDSDLPFIRAELDWLPLVLAAQKPLLGICLGGQLLARALGAAVAPRADGFTDIGYVPVTSTPAGQALFADSLSFYHWNREGFELPKGAVLLATGEQFPNQAFRYGETAYGLQFHPEMTHEMIDRWTLQGAEHLTAPGVQSREQQLQLYKHHSEATQQWLRRFLAQWLQRTTTAVS